MVTGELQDAAAREPESVSGGEVTASATIVGVALSPAPRCCCLSMRVGRWQNAHQTLEPDPDGGVAARPMAPQWPHHAAAVLELAVPSGLVLPMG